MPTLAGREVGATGFGLMGLTWRPVQAPKSQGFAAMKAALSTGANFWNGGEFYGPPESNSLQYLNEYFTKYPEDAEKVIISIKGGASLETIMPTGDEKGVQRSVGNCLKILDGKKSLDIFECARVDPKVPIEVTMRALKRYVDEGKLGGISLSECSAQSIRRAAKIVKIDAVEVEFSMFFTEILNNGVADACVELGIPIIAYSPLGRGFLAGQLKSLDDLGEDDHRRHQPRFHSRNFENNLRLVEEVEKVAKTKGCTPGQVALAWIRMQSGRNGLPVIIPIPGATTEERVLENGEEITLTPDEFEEVNEMVKKADIKGARYGGVVDTLNFGDSPEE